MQQQVSITGSAAQRIRWRPEISQTIPADAPAPDLKVIDKVIEAFGTVVLVGRDQEIFAEGDRSEYCYRVVAGVVRMVKLMRDGRRQVAEFHLPRELFGFDACETRDLTAEAVSDVTLIRYPRRRIEAQAECDNEFSRWLREVTARHLLQAHKQMLLLARKSAQERIASFLLDMAARSHLTDGEAIELPMSRSDIADYLGLTLETVSRVLNRLHRDDVITLSSTHRIEIADREELNEIGGEA